MKPEILFIYNSDSQKDKKALGYAKSLPDCVINAQDITKNPLTEQQIAVLANKLNIQPTGLLAASRKNEQQQLAALDTEDLLTLLNHRPGYMRTPIAVFAGGARFVKSGYVMSEWDLRGLPLTPEAINIRQARVKSKEDK